MSTFGKKSLIWWDYNDHSKENAIRFNHSSDEIQLKILEKWYPIGMRFKRSDGYNKSIYVIKNYIKVYWGWSIEFDTVEVSKYLYQDNKNINPVNIIPEPDCLIPLKREYKLERLFRN